MDTILYYLIQIIISILIFGVLFHIGKFSKKYIKSHSSKLNAEDYFPDEELKTLKQVYYLLIIMVIVFCIMNFFFDNDILLHNNPEFYVFNSVVDIILALYLSSVIYDGSLKNNIIILFLIPLPSIAYLLFGESLIEYWDFIRIPALLYVMKISYSRYKKFTSRYDLGKSIFLLFAIIFSSFILTIIVENEEPLNALVMVSNAFTSNGYAILGASPGGKITSIILVWSGYIISGVATATLCAAIITRHYSEKINKIEEKLEKIDELEKLIKELKEKK